MAFTRALFTSLAVWGLPGPASTAGLSEAQTVTDTCSVAVSESSISGQLNELTASDTCSVSVSDNSSLTMLEGRINVTELRVYLNPGPYHDIGAKTPATIADIAVSDTLSVQWLEQPVDENFIVSGETVRVSITEASQLLNHLAVGDGLPVSVSETLALSQSGVTDKAASDTLSVSITDVSALSVTADVVDSLSVTLSGETSSVATPAQSITASDTLTVSVDDASLINIFTGVLSLTVADDLNVRVTDASSFSVRVPTKPRRINILGREARILIRGV